MKKGRTKKEPLSSETSEPDVEVWNDPVWQPALDAFEGSTKDGYTGKSDPKALAKLLRSGKPVPEAVAVQLGVLLDPPWGKKGPRLVLEISERYSSKRDLDFIKLMISLKKMIGDARDRAGKGGRAGKLESAIRDLKKSSGHSRSFLMKAWTWKLEDTILKSSKYNPQFELSPREPGKS